MIIKFGVVAALLIFITACDVNPAERINVGNDLFYQQQYQMALVAYQSAQVASPDSPEGYYNAGSAYSMMGEFERSIAAFQQALKTADPQLQIRIYYNLGNTYFMAQRFDDAVSAYQHVLLINPDDEDARHNLELAFERAAISSPTPIQPTSVGNNLSSPTPEAFTLPTDVVPNTSELPVTLSNSQNITSTQTIDDSQIQSMMSVEDAVGILNAAQQAQQYLSESIFDAAATSGKDW